MSCKYQEPSLERLPRGESLGPCALACSANDKLPSLSVSRKPVREQACGCCEKDQGRDSYGVWDGLVHTAIFKMDNQKGPTG